MFLLEFTGTGMVYYPTTARTRMVLLKRERKRPVGSTGMRNHLPPGRHHHQQRRCLWDRWWRVYLIIRLWCRWCSEDVARTLRFWSRVFNVRERMGADVVFIGLYRNVWAYERLLKMESRVGTFLVHISPLQHTPSLQTSSAQNGSLTIHLGTRLLPNLRPNGIHNPPTTSLLPHPLFQNVTSDPEAQTASSTAASMGPPSDRVRCGVVIE